MRSILDDSDDACSGDIISDEELVLTKDDLVEALTSRIGVGKKAKCDQGDEDIERALSHCAH